MTQVTKGLLVGALTLGLAGAAGAATLNEIVMNDVSTDDAQFFEICGFPGEDLTGLTLVVIEGEGSGKGLIDRAEPITGSVGASGFYVLGDATVSPDQVLGWAPENGGQTMLLVSGFTGSIGLDVDVDDDGIADGPIGTIVDGVGVALPSDMDFVYYGVPALGPDTGDSGTANFDVAGVARCEDCSGDWGMICLAGTEGDPVCDTSNAFNPYVVTAASPGSGNLCSPVSVESDTWGQIKANYR